jgi:hypothetical protein
MLRFPCMATVIVLVGTAVACSPSQPIDSRRDPNSEPLTTTQTERVPVTGGGEVEQLVTLMPPQPHRGEPVQIRSVVRNVGGVTTRINTSMCLTFVGGTLSVDEPPMACAAVTLPADLAPGDSVFIQREVHINSQPGTYELKVQHLVDPLRFVSLDVTVLP